MATLSRTDMMEIDDFFATDDNQTQIAGTQPLLYFGRMDGFGRRSGRPIADWCDEETEHYAKRILKYHASSPVSDAEKLCQASVELYRFFVGGLYITRPRNPSVSDGDGYYLGHQGCVIIVVKSIEPITILSNHYTLNRIGLHFLQPLNRSDKSVHHAAGVERAFAAFRQRQQFLPPRTFDGDCVVERPNTARRIKHDAINL